MPQNLQQSRVIDPILTTHVQGYRQAELEGENLFPRVPVEVSGGQVLEFGKEAFKLYSSRRAPGADTKRIDLGYSGKQYSLENHSLEAKVPREQMRDASKVPGIDLASRKTNMVMRVLLLGLENDQAKLATDATKYDNNHKIALAGATKWSHADGDPTGTVETGKEAVRASIGIYPNVALLSALAFKAAKMNTKVKDQFKYTSAQSITAELLAQLWGLEKVVVGKAITFDDADVATDVWGNNAILAYVPQSEQQQMEEPAYGYTYIMTGDPSVEVPYYENNAKSWIYGVSFERAPQITGILAGYLLQTPN